MISAQDIKPKNVLIRRPLFVKLADFGISITKSDRIIGLCGTLPYMGPELLRNEAYNEKVDVYSFAMVAYEALARNRPLAVEPPMRIILSVGIHGHRPHIPAETPNDVGTLIRSAWSQNPLARPTIEQVLAYIRSCRIGNPDAPLLPSDTGPVNATASWDSEDDVLPPSPAAAAPSFDISSMHETQDHTQFIVEQSDFLLDNPAMMDTSSQTDALLL